MPLRTQVALALLLTFLCPLVRAVQFGPEACGLPLGGGLGVSLEGQACPKRTQKGLLLKYATRTFSKDSNMTQKGRF